MGPLAVLGWAAFIAVTITPPAHDPELLEAQRAFAQGRIPKALRALEQAEHTLGIGEDDLVQVYTLRATCLMATGHPDQADVAFDQLLTLRPLHEPGELDVPPPVRSAFLLRQQAMLQRRGDVVDLPLVDAPNISVGLRAGAQQVTHGVLFVRVPGDATFVTVPLVRVEQNLTAAINDAQMWERAANSGGFDVVVEGRTAHGAAFVRTGSSRDPGHLAVKPDDAAQAQRRLAAAPPPAPAVVVAPVSVAPKATSPRWPWSLPVVAGALTGATFVGVGACSAVVVTSVFGFGWAYRELTTKGIDARQDDKTRWSQVLLGSQVMLGISASALFVTGALFLLGLVATAATAGAAWWLART